MGLLDAILGLLHPLYPLKHVFDPLVLANLCGKLASPVLITFLLGTFQEDCPLVDQVIDVLQGDVLIELQLEDSPLYHQLPNLDLRGQHVLVPRDAFPRFQFGPRVLFKLIHLVEKLSDSVYAFQSLSLELIS